MIPVSDLPTSARTRPRTGRIGSGTVQSAGSVLGLARVALDLAEGFQGFEQLGRGLDLPTHTESCPTLQLGLHHRRQLRGQLVEHIWVGSW